MEQKSADVEGEHLFNNIIYYDDSLNCIENSEIFNKNIPGAFILCNNLNSFKLIKNEILYKNKRDKKILFNLIINSLNIETIINLIREDKDFESCIQNICIYKDLNKRYEKIVGFYSNPEEITDFIKKYSSKEIRPFPITKLIKYEDYIEKYKNLHFQISKFYGNLNLETSKEILEKIKSLIKEAYQSKNLKNKSFDKIIDGFTAFETKLDTESFNSLIIKEFFENPDLNKWLADSQNSNK